MIIRRAFKRGLSLAGLCVLPVLLPAQVVPSISSLQSSIPPSAQVNGAAITAGTPAPNGLTLYINGSFNLEEAVIVTWSGTQTMQFSGGNVSVSANQIVVTGVPATLFQSQGTATITVTETPFCGDAFIRRPTPQGCAGGVTTNPGATFTINAPLAAGSALPGGMVGVSYSQPFFTGGTGPYTVQFNLSSPPPNGLAATPNAGNPLSGTPSQAGSFTIGGTVTDVWGNSLPFSETINIAPPPTLGITTPSLPAGIIQRLYSATVAATGGILPYVWSATGLPLGLSINASTGAISGTPLASGMFAVTVTVSDSGGQSMQTVHANYNLQIFPLLTITTASLPSGIVQRAYSATVSATGGAPSYTWSAEGLPPGLSINPSTGVISGTPTTPGAYTATVYVSDSGGSNLQTVQAPFSLRINPLLTLTTTSLPGGRVQQSYSATVSAAGGTSFYTWSASGLPPGLSINPSTGIISGIPTTAGNFSATVSVSDTGDQNTQTNYSIQITGGLAITAASLPGGTVGQGYAGAVSAVGGVAPYTWSASGLPPGLSINAATGAISGTPGSAGIYPVTIRVSDSGGQAVQTAQAMLSISIGSPALPPLQITGSSLPGGIVGQVYAAVLAGIGGTGNYTFTVVGGSLPPHVSLASAGQLYGIPTAPGTYNFSVQISDGQNTATNGFSIQIGPGPLTPTGAPPISVPVNSALSVQFGASGGVAPYKFVLTGSAPTGTTFANGLLSGTVTAPGTYTFTVVTSDSQLPPAISSQSFTVTVTPAPLAIAASLPPGQVGQAYSGQFSATGGTGGYTWSGTVGGGLSVSSTGAVTGTPTTAGTVSISVTVTDSSGTKSSGSFSVNVAAPKLIVTTTSLPNGALTASYSATLGASGGTPPYTWTAAGLPAGLSISSSGAITGTPTGLGSFTVGAVVTDAAGATATVSLALTINPAPLKITTTGISPPVLGQSFSLGFGATGGAAPYIWTASGLPSGIAIASNGTLSGTPGSLGTFPITVSVTDVNGQTASEILNLVVTLPGAPGVNLSGLPANAAAGSQATTPVTFNTAYPVDVTVKLTLTFAPASGPDDPNVQFSTGGRTASVTVKAGSTTSLTSIGVQTGTVAGVITITSQLVAANGTDITPSPAPSRSITIGPAAPTISSVTATTTSTGFTVTIVGFDPTRAVSQITFTFAPAAGSTLQTSTVTLPAQTLFSAWYQSAASAQYGSQFSFTLPFTVAGNVSGIASVTVTLTNATGTSASVTAPL